MIQDAARHKMFCSAIGLVPDMETAIICTSDDQVLRYHKSYFCIVFGDSILLCKNAVNKQIFGNIFFQWETCNDWGFF